MLFEISGLAQQGTCKEATGFRALFDLFLRLELCGLWCRTWYPSGLEGGRKGVWDKGQA